MNRSYFNSRRMAAGTDRRRAYRALAAAVLLAGGATICEAADSVVVTAQNIWSGQTIYTADINSVNAAGCAKQTVAAPAQIVVSKITYQFLFWDINATAHTSQSVTFQPICGAANSAVALYLPLGAGCVPGEPCPPPTTDTLVAFSLNDHKIIPNQTPIEWASAGWTAGSTVVTPPSTVEALPEIVKYGLFKGWNLLGSLSISAGRDLTLGLPGQIAIAFYGFPDPDPCQTIRNELDNPMICDGLTAAQCSIMIKNLNAQLNRCEASYGE